MINSEFVDLGYVNTTGGVEILTPWMGVIINYISSGNLLFGLGSKFTLLTFFLGWIIWWVVVVAVWKLARVIKKNTD